MQKVHSEIKGLSSYFFSKPTHDKVSKTVEQEKKVALNRVYCNEHLFVPWNQPKGCILSAIRLMNMKIERSRKRAEDLVLATVWVSPNELILKPERTLEDVDVQEHFTQVSAGMQKTARWNWYACIPNAEWSTEFDLTFPDFLDAGFIKEALESGGAFCGIGGRRLHGNGRFEVVRFKSMN